MRLDRLHERDLPVTVGRYTLTGLLGEGGMARVFAAEMGGELGFRRPVAVKVVLSATPDRSRELQEQLAQEARIGGLLNHPNVAQTLDCGQLDGFPYIAMELVEGLSLSQLVRAGGPLPPGAALDLAEQSCAGLHHAHTATHGGRPLNVIHRDIKPSNLLVRRDGVVKVVDFGIAKASIGDMQLTAEGLTKGTPSYMSPEQLEALDLDPRSDLFALGSVLYYALTGRLLFDGGSITEVMMRIATVETTLERQGAFTLVDRLAPGLGDVFRRLMQRYPHMRQPHSAALGAELALVRRGLTASGPSLADLVVRRHALLERDDVQTPGPTRAFQGVGAPPSAHDLPPPDTLDEPQTPGATRVQAAVPRQDPATGWMLDGAPVFEDAPELTRIAEGWRQPRRRGASLGLVALGVLGGAVIAVLVWAVMIGPGSDGPAMLDDSPGWLPPLERLAEATPPKVEPTPTARSTPKRRERSRATPRPRATPRVVRADTPAPSATPWSRAKPAATPTPTRGAKPTSDRAVSPAPTPGADPTPRVRPAMPSEWGRTPTPTPKPTPDRATERAEELERIAAGPPALALKHKAVSRAVVGTRVQLVASVDGPADTEVMAFVGPPDGPHQKIVLTAQGGGRWTGGFDVDASLARGAVYWLVAFHADASPSRVLRGSRFQPLRITVY